MIRALLSLRGEIGKLVTQLLNKLTFNNFAAHWIPPICIIMLYYIICDIFYKIYIMYYIICDYNVSSFISLQYELIGDNTATQFFSVNENNGQLTVSRPLSQSSASSFTLVARAYDGGVPPNEDFTVFTLTMDENLNPPVINPLTYTTTINETHDIGMLTHTQVSTYIRSHECFQLHKNLLLLDKN